MSRYESWMKERRRRLLFLAATLVGLLGYFLFAFLQGALWLAGALVWTLATLGLASQKRRIEGRTVYTKVYQFNWHKPIILTAICVGVYLIYVRASTLPVDPRIIAALVVPSAITTLAKHFWLKAKLAEDLALNSEEAEPKPLHYQPTPSDSSLVEQLVPLLYAWKPRWIPIPKNPASTVTRRLELGERGENGLLARYLTNRGFEAKTEVPLPGGPRGDIVVLGKVLIEAKQDLGGLMPLASLKEKLDKYLPLLSRYTLVVLIYGDARADLEDRLLTEARTHFKYIRLGKKV